MMAEFGESVFYLPMDRDRGQTAELDSKFLPGVWLGLEKKTNETKIGTSSGVIRARTVKRRPISERWNKELIFTVVGTPWNPAPGTASGALKTAAIVPGEEDGLADMPGEAIAQARRAKILRRDFDDISFTQGCPGCTALRSKARAQNHSEICRQRVEIHISQSATGRERLEKQEYRMAEAVIRATVDPHGSTEELPPGADDGRQGGAINQKRQKRPPPQPKPDQASSPSGNGEFPPPGGCGMEISLPAPAPAGIAVSGAKKRGMAEQDDEERFEMIRQEDLIGQGQKRNAEDDNGEVPPRTSKARSSTWTGNMDAAMDALGNTSREEAMEVIHAKCQHDISELYSPPRIALEAAKHNLRGGYSFDLTVPDKDGYVWDFSQPECRKRAWAKIVKSKPFLLIGSPPCTAFSNLQNLQRDQPGGDAKVDAWIEKAKVHIEFCCELYTYQMRQGRYFLHEHPQSATSWKLPNIMKLASNPMVYKATTHMCRFGMVSTDEQGEGLVLKPTTMMTNSIEIQRELDRQCDRVSHRHVHLTGGRAKDAAIYPKALCRAVCRGTAKQMELDAADLMSVKLEVVSLIEVNHLQVDDVQQDVWDHEWLRYWDDTNGK